MEAKKHDISPQILNEALAMLKMGVPLSVVAKTLQIPIEHIHHLKDERGNNNE